jgi:hypothetical protein
MGEMKLPMTLSASGDVSRTILGSRSTSGIPSTSSGSIPSRSGRAPGILSYTARADSSADPASFSPLSKMFLKDMDSP